MEINLEVETGKERLDRWLSKELSELSRSRLAKLIESGNVKLNGKVCKSKKILVNSGDRLNLTIPAPESQQLQPEPIPLDILYEDEHLIILNKSANLVVHPAPGHQTGTLVHALLFHCKNLAGIGCVERPGIVHRLDKDTTGAIMVAKNDLAQQSLQAQLKAKTARREYLGIVYGSFRAEKGSINLPIGRDRIERKKMAVIPIERGGRAALTHWQVIERLGNYTLIEFRLETGRTHQIRVHSSHIGHPIVGDPIYSSAGSIGVNLSGQALHARKLTVKHPVSGELIEVIAPLPEEFNKLLTVLRNRFNK